MKDLNLRAKTLKSTDVIFVTWDYAISLLDIKPKAQVKKFQKYINQTKLKIFVFQQNKKVKTIQRMEITYPTRLVARIHKEFL